MDIFTKLRYEQPEVMERLCQKCITATGKKWLWQKMMVKHGLTFEEMEKQLDLKIERNIEFIKQMEETLGLNQTNGQSDQQLGTAAELSDSRAEQYFNGTEIRDSDGKLIDSDRQEIRSGQSENGPATSGGDE